jgi:hypothetical protein
MVINMSLGGPSLEDIEKEALDYAISNGVIVVAAAGNEGEKGMGYPGAYAPVISAGSVCWTGEWLIPRNGPRYRMWWLKDDPSGVSDSAATSRLRRRCEPDARRGHLPCRTSAAVRCPDSNSMCWPRLVG